MSTESDSAPRTRAPSRIRKPRKKLTAMSNDNPQPTDENANSTSFESAKAHAKEAASELRSAAEAKARELREKAEAKANEFRSSAEAKVHEFRERAEHSYDQARARTRTLQDDGETYIRENPTKAVLTALAAGFVLGLILRR